MRRIKEMLTNLVNIAALVGTGAIIAKTEVKEPAETLAKIIAIATWTVCLVCAVLVAF